jgi:hypothetical protein
VFELLGGAMAHLQPGLSGLSGLSSLHNTPLENILSDLNVLVRSNDSLTIAAHCLCDVE